jgi:hypothetical protein
VTGRTIRFDLAQTTPLLNVTLRQHWSKRRRKDKGLAWAVKVAILESGQAIPAAPFQRARVTIVRRSVGVPDRDGLVGGVKGLVDCLLHPGPVTVVNGKPRFLHPTGLGIVQDDGPDRLVLVVTAERVRSKADQGTSVTIEELA